MISEAERQRWAEYIYADDHAGRHLYASGRVRQAQADPAFDTEGVHRFLKSLEHRRNRGRDDRRYLGLVYFLLQPRLRTLLTDHLPELLRSISHTGADRLEQVRAGVRGKVLWPQTYTARNSGRIDASTLIVKRMEKSADIPENQLLKLFLSGLVAAVESIAADVGSGELPQQIEHVRQQAQVGLKSPYLRSVTRHYHATSLMRQRARRHRNWVYGSVADLESLYAALDGPGYWEAILELLRAGWLEPVKSEDLYELYVLVAVLDALELRFGYPDDVGLIRNGRKHVAHFKRVGEGEAWVYFDQSPATKSLGMNVSSEYATITARYSGISGLPRRPDVTIRFQRPDGAEHRLLIEAKCSDDRDYMRDSVYKTLAYLRDLASLWDGQEQQHPKIILAFSSSVRLKTDDANLNDDLVLWSADGDHKQTRLKHLIARACPPLPPPPPSP